MRSNVEPKAEDSDERPGATNAPRPRTATASLPPTPERRGAHAPEGRVGGPDRKTEGLAGGPGPRGRVRRPPTRGEGQGEGSQGLSEDPPEGWVRREGDRDEGLAAPAPCWGPSGARGEVGVEGGGPPEGPPPGGAGEAGRAAALPESGDRSPLLGSSAQAPEGRRPLRGSSPAPADVGTGGAAPRSSRFKRAYSSG